MGNLYGNGILVAGDAAGLALNIGFTVRGMEFALASGHFAAQTVMKAKETGNYDAQTLSTYRRLLEDSFVLKDLRSFQETPRCSRKSAVLQPLPGADWSNHERCLLRSRRSQGKVVPDHQKAPDSQRIVGTVHGYERGNEDMSEMMDLKAKLGLDVFKPAGEPHIRIRQGMEKDLA